MSDFVSTVVTIVGWVGALASVSAYAMVTRGRIAPSSMLFQGLNIGGAAALAVSASANGAWPSAVVNIIWIAIGVQAVLALKHAVVVRHLRARAARHRDRLARLRDHRHLVETGRSGGPTRPAGRSESLTRPARSRSRAA